MRQKDKLRKRKLKTKIAEEIRKTIRRPLASENGNQELDFSSDSSEGNGRFSKLMDALKVSDRKYRLRRREAFELMVDPSVNGQA